MYMHATCSQPCCGGGTALAGQLGCGQGVLGVLAHKMVANQSLPLVQAHTLEERLKQLVQDQPSQQQPQQQQELQQLQQHKVQGDVRHSSACMSAGARSGSGPGSALAPWPAASRNPYAECEPPMPAQVNSYTCQKSFKVGVSHTSLAGLLCSHHFSHCRPRTMCASCRSGLELCCCLLPVSRVTCCLSPTWPCTQANPS